MSTPTTLTNLAQEAPVPAWAKMSPYAKAFQVESGPGEIANVMIEVKTAAEHATEPNGECIEATVAINAGQDVEFTQFRPVIVDVDTLQSVESDLGKLSPRLLAVLGNLITTPGLRTFIDERLKAARLRAAA